MELEIIDIRGDFKKWAPSVSGISLAAESRLTLRTSINAGYFWACEILWED